MPLAPAASPRSHSASGPSAGSSRQKGHEPAVAFARPLEHAIVGQAVGGHSLGVVERKDAGAASFGAVELVEQLGQRERAPVLVKAKVGVGVDHFSVRRTQALRLLEERRERLGIELLVHTSNPIVSSWPGKS